MTKQRCVCSGLPGIVLSLLVMVTGASVSARAADSALAFEQGVLPVLEEHCIPCHGPDKQKSNLRLDSLAGFFLKSAVVPGDPESSRIIQAVRYDNPDMQMPPDEKLSDESIRLLEEWVRQGTAWPGTSVEAAQAEARALTAATIANEPEYWAFRSPRETPVPRINNDDWSASPIDAFVYRALADRKLEPSPEATKRVLIRRLYLDVLGLAPTPEQVKAFVTDPAPDAYEQLVDRVLASPHYGERWARHWLDVVGFAETSGFETNLPRPNAWRYRDYVIEALNNDVPYTQFIEEQLAGDALGADAATGYLVAGPWDSVKSPDIVLTKNQRDGELHDMVNRTTAAFLGLTVGCAKCHDHKFDPISQRDYYHLRAMFTGVRHGEREMRPADYEQRLRRAESVASKQAALASKLARYTPKATVGVIAIEDDGPLFHPGGAPALAHFVRPMTQGKADDTNTDSDERYTAWQANTNQVLSACYPDTAGECQVYVSWNANDGRCSKVSYVLDVDGDRTSTEDQTIIATVDQRLLASQETGSETNTGWSGFFDAGRHIFTRDTAVFLRSDEGSGTTTADILALQVLTEGVEPAPPSPRPQLRAAVNSRRNEERFDPIEATAIRFRIHDTNGNLACIDELETFESGSGENVALASAGSTPSASGEYGGELHRTVHLNDGKHGNSYSWIPGAEP